MDKKPIIIIMAGGLGKRMNSDIPKVLHKIDGLPMLYKIIEQARKINPYKILVIVGKYREIIESTLKEYTTLEDIKFIYQEVALGTGHAIMCCREYLLKYIEKDITILILSGDVPLIQSDTMLNMLKCDKVKILTTILDNPKGYGRIYEKNGVFERIIEDKDCNDEEKCIKKINCGIYSFDNKILCRYLPYIGNKNSQNEYYLTDIIEIIKKNENIMIDMYDIPKNRQIEILGVNTREQLNELNILIKNILDKN